MANFVAGAVWGLVFSGAAATVASLAAPQPAGNTPPIAPMVSGPQAAQSTNTSDAPVVAAQPETDAPELTPPAPTTTQDTPLPQAGLVDSAPSAQPQTSVVNAPLTQPDAATSTGPLEPAAEDPVFPNPLSIAPQAPVGEADVMVETATPRPVVVADPGGRVVLSEESEDGTAVTRDETPVAVDDTVADNVRALQDSPALDDLIVADDAAGPSVTGTTISDAGPADTVATTSDTAAEPDVQLRVDAPQIALADPIADAPRTLTSDLPRPAAAADMAQIDAPANDAETQPVIILDLPDAPKPADADSESTPTDTTAAGASPANDADTAADADATSLATQDAQIEAANADIDGQTSLAPNDPDALTTWDEGTIAAGKGEPDLIVSTPETGVDRATAFDPATLPKVSRIYNNDETSLPGRPVGTMIDRPGVTSDPVTGPGEEFPDVTSDPDAPALLRWASEFGNPAGLPLLSVMLIDNGNLTDGPRAVGEIPFPVTVLIDPTRAGAKALMAAYRAAGIEVAAIAALPAGATGPDAAVALEATFSTLPETVGLVQFAKEGLSRDAADSIMADLGRAGRGFVTANQGINSALRAAQGSGVPAASIYRDLDGNDQDARVIRRFIDQAAFRARQQDGVVLLGRLRADTVSALILWGTANRAGQVAMAPLSAVLSAQ